jgi:chaperonin GroES
VSQPSQESIPDHLRPLHDKVLVRRAEAEKVSPGGILLPTKEDRKGDEGEVLSAGNGLVQKNGKSRPMSVKVGDKVIFHKFRGTPTRINGEDLLVVLEDDILAVLE